MWQRQNRTYSLWQQHTNMDDDQHMPSQSNIRQEWYELKPETTKSVRVFSILNLTKKKKMKSSQNVRWTFTNFGHIIEIHLQKLFSQLKINSYD